MGGTLADQKLACPEDESSYTERNMTRNKDILDKIEVASLVDKMRVANLR